MVSVICDLLITVAFNVCVHAILITDDKFISVHLDISELSLRFMSKTIAHKNIPLLCEKKKKFSDF